MAVSSPRFFLPFFLLTFFPLSTFTTPESNGLYELNYYTLLADHFTFHEIEATFQQRYLVNATNWGGAAGRAPIFVFLGGEVDIEDSARSHGFMFDTATYSKSLVVFIENNPVIVFGASYAGMLSALLRLKYPYAAHGALASSAPLLLHVDLSPPGAYNDVVTRTFRNESESCYRIIKNSWDEFASYQDSEKLFDLFKTCRDVLVFGGIIVDWMQGTISGAAEVDYPTASDSTPAYPVKKNCAELILVADGGSEDCILGPSSFNYLSFVDYCFSSLLAVNPRRDWYPTEFGGHDIKNVLKRFGSNVIFFNGLKDAWSAGGILESLSDSIVAIVAPEGAHHVDLRPSTAEDPLWLRDVRKQEIQIISKWLEEYQQDHQ